MAAGSDAEHCALLQSEGNIVSATSVRVSEGREGLTFAAGRCRSARTGNSRVSRSNNDVLFAVHGVSCWCGHAGTRKRTFPQQLSRPAIKRTDFAVVVRGSYEYQAAGRDNRSTIVF